MALVTFVKVGFCKLLENPLGPVHVQDVATDDVKFKVPPKQIGLLLAGVATGNGLTFTVTVLGALLHPAVVPITVQIVVDSGLANGVELFTLFNPVAVDQVYVDAPKTLKAADEFWQIVNELGVAVIVGPVTVIVFVETTALPQASVTVQDTVYVPGDVKLNVGFWTDDEIFAGLELHDQVYGGTPYCAGAFAVTV